MQNQEKIKIDFSYDEAMEFIHSRRRFAGAAGLGAMTELMRRLGNPQNDLRFVHIAGTNGKGSTASYVANALTASGVRTGLYISPFVREFEERIQICGEKIPRGEMAKCAARVAEAMGDTLEITEFEAVTACAFLYFAGQNCGMVVLEVGLGGRFDATNVIEPPEVCAVTSISLDHTKILGGTEEEIAFEKCGIIKRGSRVVGCCENSPEVNAVIERACADAGAALTFADKSALEIKSRSLSGSVFSYKGGEYRLSMLGTHQIYNALTAIEICAALKLSGDAVRKSLESTKISGRCEIIGQNPTVIIDGAHNVGGAAALCRTIDEYAGQKVILVMGMLADKAHEKCLEILAPAAKLFVASQPQSPRALPCAEMAREAQKYFPNQAVPAFESPADALNYARERAKENDVIIVCGSLFMIGNLK